MPTFPRPTTSSALLWPARALAEAIEQYQAALGIDPCGAEAHNNLGSALAARGQVEQAIHHCRQALEIKPNYPDAHNNLGLIFARPGRN